MSNLSGNSFSATSSELGPRVAEAVERDGFAIVTDLIDEATCRGLVDDVRALERDLATAFGTNDFEGHRTRRIYNLISRGPSFRDLVIHERMDHVIEAILGDGFLLSGTTSMHLFPGETPQLLHADDGMISLPRPHPATLVTTLWALSAFKQARKRWNIAGAGFPSRSGHAAAGREARGDRRRHAGGQCVDPARIDLAWRRTKHHR